MKKLMMWMLTFVALAGSAARAQDAPAAAPATAPKMGPMAADADPSFDVATIKPNNSGNPMPQGMSRLQGRHYAARNVSLFDLIKFAYKLQDKQVTGGPAWINTDRYDIDAVTNPEGKPSRDQVQTMLRKLMADRFGLTFHHEKHVLSVFAMTAAKDDSKLKPTTATTGGCSDGGHDSDGGITLTLRNCTLTDVAEYLQFIVLDRPVVNQSETQGRFDLDLAFMPDESMFGGRMHIPPDAVSSAPTLFEAIQEYGVKLTAEKIPADVLVVDKAEKPSAN